MERQRLTVDARRAQLLSFGKQLFAERAIDQISADHIAQAAGVSKGLMYHYFGSKRGYYLATLEHVAGEILAAVVPALTGSAAPVAVAVDGFLDYVEAHATLYVAVLRGGSDAEAGAIIAGIRAALVAALSTPGQDSLRVYGWIGFVECAVLRWLDIRDRPRAALSALLVEAFEQLCALEPQNGRT